MALVKHYIIINNTNKDHGIDNNGSKDDVDN